jgi:hypothetical protein
MVHISGRAVWGVGLVLLALAAATPVAAQEAGSYCPDFGLPWLDGGGDARASDLFAGQTLTVLVVWNRGCPHCTEVALAIDDLVEWLRPYPVRAVPILFGPDDPLILRSLLFDHGVKARHLWDASGAEAAAMGLGEDHLRVLIADSTGFIHETMDSSMRELVDAAGPDVIEILDRLSREPKRAAVPAMSAPPPAMSAPVMSAPRDLSWSIDARARMQQTEGARRGDTGLYGEPWENGTLLLYRSDLRLRWQATPRVEVVPWLRVSNEDESALTEGPEQFASRHGTLSVNARAGAFSGTLGAFPLRLSPFVLQRWDAEDAPPLGGASGCAVCGAGVSGISQKSLEVLAPEYTFEGASASAVHPRARLTVWGAIPRWEKRVLADAPAVEIAEARYRRTLSGAMVDIGRIGDSGGPLGLPSPLGLRIAYVSIQDDRRSVPSGYVQPMANPSEHAWTFVGQAGPWRGLTADAEQAYVSYESDWGSLFDGGLYFPDDAPDAWAVRAGVRGAWTLDRWALAARVHRIRTEPEFAPLYRALTYEANQNGWRFAGSVEWLSPAPRRDGRVTLSAFVRTMEETKPTLPLYGPAQETMTSVSVTARPRRNVQAGAHWVRTHVDNPHPALPDRTSDGYSFDLGWTGSPSVDPLVRLDVVRPDPGSGDERTLWQAYLMVRVVR